MTREEAIVEYQRLLRTEWSEASERETIKLLSTLTDIRVAAGESYDIDAIIALIDPHDDPFIYDVQSLLITQMLTGLWTDLALDDPEGEWKRLGDAMWDYIVGIPDEAEMHFKLSSWYEGTGRDDEAFEAAKKALELTDPSEIVYSTRAHDVYFRMQDRNMHEQIPVFLATLPEDIRKELEG